MNNFVSFPHLTKYTPGNKFDISIFILVGVIAILYFTSGNKEINTLNENINTEQENRLQRNNVPPVKTNQNNISNKKTMPEETIIEPEEVKPKETKKEVAIEQQISVPSVLNLSPEAARLILKNLGLQVGTISKLASGSENRGIVFRQIPTAGSKLKKGSSVNLIVGE